MKKKRALFSGMVEDMKERVKCEFCFSEGIVGPWR